MSKRILFLLLTVLSLWVPAQSIKAVVHLITHAHVDAGWVRTFENTYSNTGRKILDTVTNALYGNEDYRFNWADLIFLERWWQDADEDMKFKFRAVLEKGQLQIVHPGFIMADEAVVSYAEAIENFEIGLHFLYDTFAIVPHIAWGLDTFGFSAYTPALLNKYGIDSVYLSRIGNLNRGYMEYTGVLNYIWEGHPVYGIPSAVFVSQSQFGTYSPSNLAYDINKSKKSCPMEALDENPPRTCMETLYYDALNEFVESKFYSKEDSVEEYHFPVLWGDDSAFTDAHYNFRYLVKMIAVFDQYSEEIFGRKIELRMSTMDEFFAALKSMDYEYPLYRGDFLPEIEDPVRWRENTKQIEYWTGYYSNKPVYKELIRDCFKRMRLAQAFTSYVVYQKYLNDGKVLDANMLSRNMDTQLAAIVQLHHDAVTGTHTVNVNYDYVDKIAIANKFVQDQVSLLYQELDEMYRSKSQSLFESILQYKALASKGRVIKVFNPNVKTLEEYAFNVTVAANKYYLCLSENMEQQQAQVLPLSYYDSYDKLLAFNKTHSNLFFRQARVAPYSVQQLFLFEFASKFDCLDFFKVYVPTHNADKITAEEVCVYGQPQLYEYRLDQEVPKIELTKKNDKLRIVFEPQTGLIDSIEFNKIEVDFSQQFFAYITQKNSGSGYYLFDPMNKPVEMKELRVTQMVKYTGPIFTCVHAFMERTRTFQTIDNAHFENKLCVEKEHIDRIRQTLNAKSIIAHEILLRTHIEKVNERDIDNSLEYFTHDSMYAVRRKVFSHDEAIEREIITTLKQLGLEDDGSVPDEKLNSYPCNTGLIVKEKVTDTVLGFAFSHGLMCHLIEKNKWDLMLTRATQNPDFQQGIHDQQDDFDYTTLNLDFLIRKVKKEQEFDAFVTDYYDLQFDRNYGLLVDVQGLKKSNAYKVHSEALSQYSQFFSENANLTFIKSQFDSHTNRIYFYLANKHNNPVTLKDLKTPKDLEATRCNVMDTFFCNDDRYSESEMSMFGSSTSGEILEMLELTKYSIFELGEEKVMSEVNDDQAFVIPPLSEFSLYIQLPQPGSEVNHFQDESRHFYKSERKIPVLKNPNVTCVHYTLFFAAGIVFYLACIFFVYSLYHNLTRDKIAERKKKRLEKYGPKSRKAA